MALVDSEKTQRILSPLQHSNFNRLQRGSVAHGGLTKSRAVIYSTEDQLEKPTATTGTHLRAERGGRGDDVWASVSSGLVMVEARRTRYQAWLEPW